MAVKYQAFPGMDDILPGEVEKWQWLEEKARTLFSVKRFREIRTPILEPTELFTRAIGETTDIVHKEMYTFQDRGERFMTMRPEMTASVARAVTEHGLLKTSPNLSLFYMGPMFRAERPQAGRKRQFHQIGAELVNVPALESTGGAGGDLTILAVIRDFLQSLGIQNLKFRINDLTLINGENGDKVRSRIRDYFESCKSQLDPDSLFRLDKNVLRIFDSKIPQTRALVDALPWNEVAPASDYFLSLCEKLRQAGVPLEVEPKLVRGLDYYTGVVFEVASSSLGAQDALAGGGRYDRLYEQIGSSPVPCTGFSIGVERLLMVLEKNAPSITEQMKESRVYFIPLCESVWDAESVYVEDAARSLRQFGFQTEVAKPSLKLGDQLKKAAKAEARYVVIAGEKERQSSVFQVKNMDLNEQKEIRLGELFNHLVTQKGIKIV